MSTRCTVYIKLKDEDKGAIAISRFGELNIPEDANYMGIYCHHDGYPDGVGKTLEDFYKTYDDVFNLIINGDTSSIYKNPDSIPYYAHKEGYSSNKPDFSIKRPRVTQSYLYIFENDKWSIYE